MLITLRTLVCVALSWLSTADMPLCVQAFWITAEEALIMPVMVWLGTCVGVTVSLLHAANLSVVSLAVPVLADPV